MMTTHMSAALLLALVLAACCLLDTASAHGGGLHRWTFNADVVKVVKTASIRYDVNDKVATCSDWSILNYTAVSPTVYTMPFFPSSLNMSVSGSVDIHSYLSNNCTNGINSGLFPFLKFSVSTKQGKKWKVGTPKGALTTFAYGFTGSCSAPGNLYRNSVTLQDSRFNLAWWDSEGVISMGMNMTNKYPGYLWGASVNSWFVRPNGLRSIVLLTQSGPSFCCNVKYDGFQATDAVLARGKNCTSSTYDK